MNRIIITIIIIFENLIQHVFKLWQDTWDFSHYHRKGRHTYWRKWWGGERQWRWWWWWWWQLSMIRTNMMLVMMNDDVASWYVSFDFHQMTSDDKYQVWVEVASVGPWGDVSPIGEQEAGAITEQRGFVFFIFLCFVNLFKEWILLHFAVSSLFEWIYGIGFPLNVFGIRESTCTRWVRQCVAVCSQRSPATWF